MMKRHEEIRAADGDTALQRLCQEWPSDTLNGREEPDDHTGVEGG